MSGIFIPVDEHLNSTLKIGSFSFPFALFHDDLNYYCDGFVNWHQQTTIEISVMLEGSAEVQVFEQRETVSAGDVFFIMPGYLHTVRMGVERKARYFTLIFDPALLYGYQGSFFYDSYYRPFLQHAMPFCHIRSSERWLPVLLEKLFWIEQYFPSEVPEIRLQITQKLQDVWCMFSRYLLEGTSSATNALSAYDQERITVLMQHLHQHFSEPFSLSALARQINVSRGECCRFFKKMMHTTPSEYLLEYRLTKSVELLCDQTRSVTEIAGAVGFNSPSYFISQFRKKLGQTPKAYRNQLL